MTPQKIEIGFKYVRKRDGRLVPFNKDRIVNAVFKAMKATQEGDEKDAYRVADAVVKDLIKRHSVKGVVDPKTVPGIEEIQDIVEENLIIKDFPKTAKAYILYRQERAQLREKRREVPEHVKELVAGSKKYFRNPLAEFIYYRSYSRWMESEGRRETWIESVDRFMGYMKSKVGDNLTDSEYGELREAILSQEVVPSMRLMWSADKAAEATNVAAYNCSFIAPQKLRDLAEIMYVCMCGTGVGFSVEHQNIHAFPQIKRQTGKVRPTHIVEDSKEGWAEAFYLGLKAWFNGEDVGFDFSKLRPEGARLKTMGGKSSGPRPLRELLDFSRNKILSRQGSRLNSLDVHDIICKTGDIVVMGGVRRSALISLSDLDDSEMRDAKKGQFYLTEPQRTMANNSAVYNDKPSCTDFMAEWLALAKSGSGERGIFNRGGVSKQLPARRWKVFEKDFANCGTNPCVTGDTWIMTDQGPHQVSELINTPFLSVVNGKFYESSSGFFETGIKDVFEVKTKRGFNFKATANHKVLVIDYKTQKTQKNSWKNLSDLRRGDRVVLHNHKNVNWLGSGTEKEGWLLGNLVGDGNIEKSGKVNLDYWGEQKELMMNYASSLVHATVGGRSDLRGHISKTNYARVGSVKLGELAAQYGLVFRKKYPGKLIEKSSSDFYKGFLRGWFDADGSVQGSQNKGVSIRLSSSNLDALQIAQRMLARLGIISTIYQNRRDACMRYLPDGRGGQKIYYCTANHDLVISGNNIINYKNKIGFTDVNKIIRLKSLISNYKRRLNEESFASEITEVNLVGREMVYDCQVPDVNAFDGNGCYLHNCGEIILKSKQFCNLSEVVARSNDTLESLLRKIRLATILGTYQSTLTDFPFLSSEWKKNCEEERLLGVSITGQWDCALISDGEVLKKLKEEALMVNKKYARRLGVNVSTCITCVKPSGTVSQLVDASSGMHPRHAKYYVRRIRISATDSLFHMLRDQKIPYYPEVGQAEGTATTYVLEFPVAAPKGAVTLNKVNAIDQLEHWKKVKTNFTEHNPSVTISVAGDEWIGVENWLYENWEILGGLSFLPKAGHVYALAPYEEVDEEEYKKRIAEFPQIDFSQILLYEKEDETEGAKELACVAGVCEY